MATEQNPRFRIKVGEPIGTELFFAWPEIYPNEKTYLDADAAAGATSLTVNGINFANQQYIVIGRPGVEKTEIVQISGTPSATLMTLTVATSFPHNRGDMVQFIPYNQITPERSTDGGTNFTGLSAVSIRADSLETYLQRTTDASTDVYRFRFTNSTSGLNSGYSDNATASGYADNTVYSIKQHALQTLGEVKNELITDKFLNDALMEGRRIVDQDPRILRWSFRTSFNSSLGGIIPGAWSVTAPTDLRDRNTYKNILAVRIGLQSYFVVYQDNRRFRQNYLNVGHTTLNGAISLAATSIILTSSGNFDASGAATLGANSETGVLTNIAYTANTLSTNTLSGVTSAIATNSGIDIWQNATFGIPSAYTIENGVIYFDIPFDTVYAGQDIYIDYYKALSPVVSDADVLDEPFYDMYVPWLRWKIKYLKANGKISKEDDTDYKEFTDRVTQLITQEITGQFVNFIPSTNGFMFDANGNI